MTERALGLLREKGIVLLDGIGKEISRVVNTKRLCVEAIDFVDDMTNMSTTTSIAGGGTPYSLWYGTEPKMDHLQPFGTTGYMRTTCESTRWRRLVRNAL